MSLLPADVPRLPADAAGISLFERCVCTVNTTIAAGFKGVMADVCASALVARTSTSANNPV